jgi:glycine C-acetyltransferase/8-amino-7-oxononanoate synthase
MFETLEQELSRLDAQGLRRSWRRVEAIEGGRIRVGDRWLIHLASNSYLGLHQHPRVIATVKEAVARYGCGAGSARLIGGNLHLHEELEAELAAFKQTEAALLFPTGYMANLGVIATLVGPQDLVIGDRLNHASLVDACRLSRATFCVYPHGQVERLEETLKARRGRFRRALVVTEGLFSMDGDLSPLREIVEVARRHRAWLLVDDAHATGVLGDHGRGSLEHLGIPPEGILQMGTLSKALGSLGGFIAGPRLVIEILKNKARPFIYTTALPPPCVAAALEALRVIQEEPVWRSRLWRNIELWIAGLTQMGCPLLSSVSSIVPIRTGSTVATMAMAQALLEAGVYAPGIRPPTVPRGTARIRTSVSSLHGREDLETALDAFQTVWDKNGA